ncbi:hypothetical protein BJV77DRAFT_995271 [Russula vinacea]|nr:hypothetical protein BJV77DRAFT_995271 [Russula vinacea]
MYLATGKPLSLSWSRHTKQASVDDVNRSVGLLFRGDWSPAVTFLCWAGLTDSYS